MNFCGNFLLGEKANSKLANLSKRADVECVVVLNKKYNQNLYIYQPWMSLGYFEELTRISPEEHIIPCATGLQVRSEIFDDTIAGFSKLDKRQLSNNRIVRGHEPEFIPFIESIREILQLIKADPVWDVRLEILVNEIIPQKGRLTSSGFRRNGSGLSSRKYRKGIFLSLPDKSESSFMELALNLAHEVGHQALMTYQIFDKIISEDHRKPIYSVIRGEKRPAIMSFHAMVAVMFMLDFLMVFEKSLEDKIERSLIQQRKKSLQNDLDIALAELHSLSFTKVGEQIIKEAIALRLYSMNELAS